MSYEENLAEFFGADDPGVVAATLAGATILGHLRNAYQEANGVSARAPVFECLASSIGDSDIGQAIVIAGVSYTIRNVEEQDDGAWVNVILEKV